MLDSLTLLRSYISRKYGLSLDVLTLITLTSSITDDIVFINLISDWPTEESLRVSPLTTRLATDDALIRQAFILDP